MINTGGFFVLLALQSKEINCIFTEFQPTTSTWGITSLPATEFLLLVTVYQPEGIKLDFSESRLETCWAEIKKYFQVVI